MGKNKEEDIRRKKALQGQYAQRITIAKAGREYYLNKDYVNATKKYTEYLGILAETFEAKDIYSIQPSMFDSEKSITEMLLISHVYWELARINEMTPKLQKTYKKCLDQFVRFTINRPYQVFNSEMMRKYIKKSNRKSIHFDSLNNAYSQIFVQSKKCYIATFCFEKEAFELGVLRSLKSELLKIAPGRKFVQTYYKYSSALVHFLENKEILTILTRLVIKPPLTVLSYVLYYLLKLFNKV